MNKMHSRYRPLRIHSFVGTWPELIIEGKFVHFRIGPWSSLIENDVPKHECLSLFLSFWDPRISFLRSTLTFCHLGIKHDYGRQRKVLSFSLTFYQGLQELSKLGEETRVRALLLAQVLAFKELSPITQESIRK